MSAFDVAKAVFILAFAAAIALPLLMSAMGGFYAFDGDGDGDYEYTGYEVSHAGGSNYVSDVGGYGQGSMEIELADYRGTVPDEVIVRQGGHDVATEKIFGVEDSTVVSLDGAETGNATIVLVSVSGGGFAGSEEVTVLDRHTVEIEKERRSAECSGRFICNRYA